MVLFSIPLSLEEQVKRTKVESLDIWPTNAPLPLELILLLRVPKQISLEKNLSSKWKKDFNSWQAEKSP
jgi:hypothetical protein